MRQGDHGLKLTGELYVTKKRIRELIPAERYKIRQQEVPQVLARIRDCIAAWSTAALPSSALGKALAYLVEQWPRLIRYTEDGRLEIDNNGVENAIRPFVVGRKNWPLSNPGPGVKTSANLNELIVST
ncbi:MAG: IS66 family transposase [Magnetococcus sp. WYHC-3]